jgi:ribosomal protein S18 acetylase RimI-like enzyme
LNQVLKQRPVIKASTYNIRPAAAEDAQQLIGLMRQLAVFESYDDDFQVRAEDLLARGLDDSKPAQFQAFVAELPSTRELCGYAVATETLFTYNLRPMITLKELFVNEEHRRQGLAERLFSAVKTHASSRGAAQMRWLVLPDNEAARQMYARQGGKKMRNGRCGIVKFEVCCAILCKTTIFLIAN